MLRLYDFRYKPLPAHSIPDLTLRAAVFPPQSPHTLPNAKDAQDLTVAHQQALDSTAEPFSL